MEEKIKKIKKLMVDDREIYDISDFFKIFGDSTRLKILWALDNGPLTVTELCEITEMNKSSISHQLGTLRRSGIVKCRKSGKEVFYMLDDEHIQKVFEVGIEHIEHKK